ncbi:hypothetical protein JKP88DRAFT_353492 [Tribonema minus]|uniref:PDZ domain-containing protein n=1 Tax=Tribonema minus TaxID=303371 RepID=A0A835Z5U3_9STRA|nr:hypothetical protein JKP88DRAFT_353492 [Tribonema minus]
MKFLVLCLAVVVASAAAFVACPTSSRLVASNTCSRSASSLRMSDDDEDALTAAARAARKAGPNDRVVEIRKPLGLVLEENEKGDVFITKVKDNSNASRNPKVFPGDKISFISATFGDDLWSVRGAGLARVQNAVRVRQGDSVRLVLESTNESKSKIAAAAAEAKERKKYEEDAQVKRDRLLKALDEDTKKKSKKFFGLF